MASCACQSFRSVAFGFVDGVGEAVAVTPSDVSVRLLCPRCCGAVSGVMVEQGGFVQELSRNYDLGSWWRRLRLKMATLKNGRWFMDGGSGVISRLRRCDESRVGKARGRSPVDVPQRYVPCHAQQARSSAPQKPWWWWCFRWRLFSSSIGGRLSGASGWRWPFVSVCAGFSLQNFKSSCLRTVSLVVSVIL
jgi:hypothetical protein